MQCISIKHSENAPAHTGILMSPLQPRDISGAAKALERRTAAAPSPFYGISCAVPVLEPHNQNCPRVASLTQSLSVLSPHLPYPPQPSHSVMTHTFLMHFPNHPHKKHHKRAKAIRMIQCQQPKDRTVCAGELADLDRIR